jgi:hypothetical protein
VVILIFPQVVVAFFFFFFGAVRWKRGETKGDERKEGIMRRIGVARGGRTDDGKDFVAEL